MARKPSVSILMPSYNREMYISEAIQSVLQSKYIDFELIIVDDNSIDDTYKIAKEFSRKDERVRVSKNTENLGQFANRNRAAELASGVYLKYLDSDDLLYQHTLEVMVEAMERYPEAAFAFQHSLKEDHKPYPIYLNQQESFREHFLSHGGLFNCGPSGVIFKREIFQKEGGFKTDNNYVGNDTELLIRLGLKYPVIKLPPALVWWRRHESQAIKDGYRTGEYFFKEFYMQVSFLNEELGIIPDHDKSRAKDYLIWKTSRKVLLLMRSLNIRLAFKMLKLLPINFIDVLKSVKKYNLTKLK